MFRFYMLKTAHHGMGLSQGGQRLNCTKARPEDQICTYDKKDEALKKGGRLKAMGKNPSMRDVAKLGIDLNYVKRV